MRVLAEHLAAHPAFRNAVTLADVDHVPIEVVLDETREFYAAARLGRLLVTNARATEAEAGDPNDTHDLGDEPIRFDPTEP